LVINGRFMGRQISGVERYAREITSHLPGPYRLLAPPAGAQRLRGHLWEQLVLPRQAGNQLLWSPANTGPLLATNQVVTIHDTNAIEHPEWYRAEVAAWYRLMLPLLARRARKVFTVSYFSRRRLVEIFKLLPEQVVVIYPGVNRGQFHPVSETDQAEFRRREGLGRPYLLFVGTPGPGKNLSRLLQAWQRLARQFPDVELLIAGREGPVTKSGPSFSPAGRLRWMGAVAEGDLAALYAAAEALILPSFAEGFGLPALEAMACGLPVIAAEAGALPEVVGDAGVLVDPLEVPNLVEAIQRVLCDRSLRLELCQRGLERSACFTWERAAQAVYQEALTLA
jgi:glycosyltransferase involved in cell wall biosynthesis